MHLALKNLIVLLLLSCLIQACNRPPKIDGVWGVVYTINANGQKVFYRQKELFDFEGDSLKVIWIGNEQNGKFHKTHLFRTAILKKNPWRYTAVAEDSSDFILSVVSKDSLVLSSSYHRQQIVLKPLERNYNKPYRPANLVGKAYKSEVQGISSTLDFVDKEFMIITVGGQIEKVKWSLVNYKGYQFLDASSFYLLQSLRLDSEGLLFLTNYHIGTNTNTYSPITPTYRKEQLYGSWVRLDDEKIPPGIYGEDNKIGLEIDADFFVTKSKIRSTRKWGLSSNGTFIFFRNSQNGYKILDLTDSTMQLQSCCSAVQEGFNTSYIRGKLD